MKVALVVGHTKDKPGACNSTYGVCEFGFNDRLVNKVDCLIDERCEVEVVYRDNYKALPDKINDLNPDFIICFHANSFNTSIVGSETLYYYKSSRSKRIAEIFQNRLVTTLNLYDRGIRPRSSEQRGGYILKNTNAPCIILEPFFIDNDEECKRMSIDWKRLAAVCRDSIYEVIEKVV